MEKIKKFFAGRGVGYYLTLPAIAFCIAAFCLYRANGVTSFSPEPVSYTHLDVYKRQTSLGASLLTFAEETSKPYAGKYYTDFDSMEEAKTAAEDLTRELAQEGDVLLKNKDNALPLSGKEWVSVFGVTSDNLIGASDSAGAFSGGSTGSDTTVPDALEAAGFKVNPTLKAYYKNDTSEHGDEDTTFNGQVRNSFSLYNDCLLYTFA